ncbi:hypothetical protein [Nocardia sp. SC052]|uniref:Tc toxin subunit A-related protein n=1 Tax=Nocardia sichangensis TaxID=3385975 RepID=UPI0039A3C56F
MARQIVAFLQGSSNVLGRLTPASRVGSSIDVGIDDGTAAKVDSLGLHRKRSLAPAAGRAESGLAAAVQGRFDAAVDDFRAAIESATDAERPALQLNLGAALIQTGALDAAEATLKRAEQGFSQAGDSLGGAQVKQNLAVLLASKGQASEARELFVAAEGAARKAAGDLNSAAKVVADIGRKKPVLADLVRRTDGRRIDTNVRLGAAPMIRGRLATRVPNPTITAGPALAATALRSAEAVSISEGGLDDLGAGLMLVLRDPADTATFHSTALVADFAKPQATAMTAGFLTADKVRTLSWTGSDGPAVADLIAKLYEPRRDATSLLGLVWAPATTADTAARLAHIYYFETALGLGDAYAGLEEWDLARSWYLAAADYKFVNMAIEAPLLWHRIAATYLGEGDGWYRRDELQKAAHAYANVLKPVDLTAPIASPLYEHTRLSATGALIPALMTDPESPPDKLGAGTAALVLDIAQRLSQIAAGLDWFGVPANFVPPFTFDHLQNSARYLAQQAKFAERDYIQFTEQHESSTLTKMQLEHAAASAKAELDVVMKQRDAAALEATVARSALRLANQRKSDAEIARDEYATMSTEQNTLEYMIAFYSLQNSWEQEAQIKGGPDAGRHVHEVVSDMRHRLGETSQTYELLRMDQNIAQLGIGAEQAANQVEAAKARLEAANWAVRASVLRADQASQLAAQFNSQTFTPEVWWQLAQFMRHHARRYLGWATKVARLMERVYEFEQDTVVDRIRTDYITGAVAGLLGADQLLGDIDYFTYHHLTQTDYRPQRVTTQLSLAQRFPFAFQTQFRTGGGMTFDISLDDVERTHPGAFNQRIQAVEARVIGPVPIEGLHGTLRNSGFSQYRRRDGQRKFRVQDVETLVLSAHDRGDMAMFRPRTEMLGVFEGAGLASTWTIEFPPSANDINYEFVVDVELTFHYEAGFDRQLEINLRNTPLPPEAKRANTAFSLRWDLPDRFFVLQSTGAADLELGPEYFPRHHLDPMVRSVSVQLLGADGPLGAGLDVGIGAPGVAAVAVTTNAKGRVESSNPTLAPLTGRSVTDGVWPISLSDDPNVRADVYDVVLFVEYDYTPRGAG